LTSAAEAYGKAFALVPAHPVYAFAYGRALWIRDYQNARIAVAKKDLLSAKDSLAAVTEEALKMKTVPRENAFAYSQAFYVMGMINEADGKPQEALENYLRTVTVFYNDPSSRAAAQERADALRSRNKGRKTTEQLTVP
jgi:hypothetical protein